MDLMRESLSELFSGRTAEAAVVTWAVGASGRSAVGRRLAGCRGPRGKKPKAGRISGRMVLRKQLDVREEFI